MTKRGSGRGWWAVLCLTAVAAATTATGARAADPAPVGDPVLVGAGDVASCKDLTGAEATAKLLDGIPGTVFIPGDLAYPDGSAFDFKNCFDPTWGRHKARTRPAPGNHEYHTPGAAGYFAYWGDRAGEAGKGYYSFDLGQWHILSLNSNCDAIGGCGEGSPQEAWVRADLKAHPAECTMAYWHHPLFSSGVSPEHALHPEMRPIWRDLYDAGAELVVNGHEHNYERFAPQDPDGLADPAQGLREIVVGVGGKDFDLLTNVKPNSEVRNASAFGLLKLTLHDRSYDWEFVPVPGHPFADQGTGTCHGPVAATSNKTGLHLIKSLPVGGTGGWDYLTLDPEARRLYVTRGEHVMVLDADSEKVVGDIPDTPGVHGVALVPDSKRGVTSNGRANTATIFDLLTLAPVAQVKTGTKPDAIVYDPASHRVFTMNGGSANATAIDVAKAEAVGTVDLGGSPEFAVADGAGRLFVNLEDKSEIVAVDTQALKVVSRWPLAPCEAPTGLALDREKHRLFSGCHNRVLDVVDADKGAILGSLPIGSGVDATAFDPDTGFAFSANGDGTLTVVREDKPGHYEVVENVATQAGARTMALDPKTHRIFLSTAAFEPLPAEAAGHARPRPVPGSFTVLVVGK